MTPLTTLTVRVYGILIQNTQVLLSHENLRGLAFTKFPGGGLELGEPPQECLKREFKEELGLDIQVKEVMHVPDFVVVNYFKPEEQVLVIHYHVKPINPADLQGLNLSQKSLESLQETNETAHSWISIPQLKDEQLTFPADKAAARKLRAIHGYD